jgi:NAD(P)-dependent dehydrogenase (short-subunit alcohol dehydrogenase family)
LALDVASDESIKDVFDEVKSSSGRVDALTNDAGMSTIPSAFVPIRTCLSTLGANFDLPHIRGECTLHESFTKLYDVNVAGAHVLTYESMRLLLKSADPRLIFVGRLSAMSQYRIMCASVGSLCVLAFRESRPGWSTSWVVDIWIW